jgi:hypothetical protein
MSGEFSDEATGNEDEESPPSRQPTFGYESSRSYLGEPMDPLDRLFPSDEEAEQCIFPINTIIDH